MDEHLELLRVLAAFATSDSDLAGAARARVDQVLGDCEWCGRGYPLSTMNPDVHVETLHGGGAFPCQRADSQARELWSRLDR